MQPLEEPDETDCCHSGCTPCIFDVYQQQISRQQASIPALPNCISQTTYTDFHLVDKQRLTEDVYLFIFQHPGSDVALHYNPGQHFLLKNVAATDDGVLFTRAYTPIPCDLHAYNRHSSFGVIIKLYANGKMSQYIGALELGAVTRWRGPYGDFKLAHTHDHVLGVTQGTGLAPVLAIMHRLLADEECDTRIHLFACFPNLDAVLCRHQLHRMTDHWNFHCRLYLPHEHRDISDRLLYREGVRNGRRLVQQDFHDYFQKCDVDSTFVLICGSDLFTQSVRDMMTTCRVRHLHVF